MKISSVPFFSLHEQTQRIKGPVMAAFENLLNTQNFVGGPSVAAFEKDLAAYLDVKHVISCNSGTDALWLAVRSMETKSNDIVLTTPFSFIASASELIPHGAHPVFIDVHPKTFAIDPNKIIDWLSKKTHRDGVRTIHTKTGFPVVGMIPVHIFGQCADMTALTAIAQEWNLWMIEDTAQAIGAHFNGKQAGTMSGIGTFSFYPTKNLGAFGDAGCCVTNDDELAETLVRYRNHGRKSHYHYESYGLNSRLDAVQAEVLRIKLKYVDEYNEKRRSIAYCYDQAFEKLPFLQIPAATTGIHTYHQYCIVIKDAAGTTRDEVSAHLESQGIGTRVFYPQSLHEISYLRTHPGLTTQTPISDSLTRTILALPVWPEMSNEQVAHVISSLVSMPLKKTSTFQYLGA